MPIKLPIRNYLISPKSHPIPNSRSRDIKKVQKTATHKKRQNVLGPQGNTREKKFFNFGSKNVLYGALEPAESISGLRKIFEKFPGKLESKNRFATFGHFGYNFSRLKWTPNKVYI
uniref:Uncharacterized protein n=1 Tax=Meloidogyne incognita TaxID=6306 RepID=A0A914P3Z2_MELIC